MSLERFPTNRGHLTALWALLLLLGAAPALAESSDGGVLSRGFKHNVDQPIEISADTMEVKQDDELVFFSGTVDAVQGDMHLQSDLLEVYYRPKGTTGNSDKTSFSRIKASGGVRFKTPKETATGDWAVYDVDSKVITVGGQVVLSSGGNNIKGTRLVLNLATGRSRMESGAADATGEGRVRATFIPEAKKNGEEAE